jgi:single-stranded-DNA-specific exonuclease
LTDKRGIVLKHADWNPGVVGIAASKLAERYYRPVVLLSERDGVLTGSARSIEGVDLHAALKANERYFTRFGGHAYAAMTLPAENFEAFAAGFDESVRAAAPEETFLPAARYEAEAPFSELTMQLAGELAMLAPFGEGNPMPVFRTDGAAVKRLPGRA